MYFTNQNWPRTQTCLNLSNSSASILSASSSSSSLSIACLRLSSVCSWTKTSRDISPSDTAPHFCKTIYCPLDLMIRTTGKMISTLKRRYSGWSLTLARRWKMVGNANWVDVTFMTSKKRWGHRVNVESTWKRWLMLVKRLKNHVDTTSIGRSWTNVCKTMLLQRRY